MLGNDFFFFCINLLESSFKEAVPERTTARFLLSTSGDGIKTAVQHRITFIVNNNNPPALFLSYRKLLHKMCDHNQQLFLYNKSLVIVLFLI